MKRQTVVTGDDRIKFEERVQANLNVGWRMIPESLRISTSISVTNKGEHRCYIHTDRMERYAVILEKEE